MSKLIVFLLIGCLFLGTSAKPSASKGNSIYNGAQVLTLKPNKLVDLDLLKKLVNEDEFDFWKPLGKIGNDADVLIPAKLVSRIKSSLKEFDINFNVKINDVGKLIEEVADKNDAARKRSMEKDVLYDWESFWEYDKIMSWMDELATNFPNLVTVTEVGQSFEGRTMKLMKVSTGGDDKPAVFCEAGIHAREWIAPATLTYMINELVVNNTKYTSSLEAIDFYFMPSVNPDGYEFSRLDTRLWRKNRSIFDDESCPGTDGNRNYDINFGGQGASSRPCATDYHGPSAFSEPNTQVIRDQILANSDRTHVYISYHAYMNGILRPWGYDWSLPTEDEADLVSLCEKAAAALYDVHQTEYVCILAGDLYPASGASDDWTYSQGVKYSYTVELIDEGYGFVIPPEYIIGSGEESFEAFRVIFEHLRDNPQEFE